MENCHQLINVCHQNHPLDPVTSLMTFQSAPNLHIIWTQSSVILAFSARRCSGLFPFFMIHSRLGFHAYMHTLRTRSRVEISACAFKSVSRAAESMALEFEQSKWIGVIFWPSCKYSSDITKRNIALHVYSGFCIYVCVIRWNKQIEAIRELCATLISAQNVQRSVSILKSIVRFDYVNDDAK